MEAIFWDFLGRKQALIFGEECGSATVWMLAALVQRTVICYLRLDSFIPYGLIFAFPLLVQVCFFFNEIIYFDLTVLCEGHRSSVSILAKY
jgi:hypothetical protein